LEKIMANTYETSEDAKIAVFGIYKTINEADAGVTSLKHAGFTTDDISALLPDGDKTRQFAHEKGTKAPEGASTGGATGAILGGTLGWLAGIGSLAIPGVGPFIAAGPIMAALAGAGVGSAVGALSGALIGLGIPEYEAKRYEGFVKDGGILVSIHCKSREKRDEAKRILGETGASDISSTGEARADLAASDTSVVGM
jgi:hypothetical protein